MSIVTVAAGLANHLRGMREFSYLSDIATAHKTGLNHLLTYNLPNTPQLHAVSLRTLESDYYKLIFDCMYTVLNSERAPTDTISLRVTVVPTFGGWLDVDIDGGVLPHGGRDRPRVRDAFALALSTPVEWDGVFHTYKNIS